MLKIDFQMCLTIVQYTLYSNLSVNVYLALSMYNVVNDSVLKKSDVNHETIMSDIEIFGDTID